MSFVAGLQLNMSQLYCQVCQDHMLKVGGGGVLERARNIFITVIV